MSADDHMILYIAGKVSKQSQFGTQHWRDSFVEEISQVAHMKLTHLDPIKYETETFDPQSIFDKDCWLINQVDCVIVYLSDDISVGGSQEMLIAKYLKKPLIGYAPYGGKFNAGERESMGQVIQNYVDPFVFATCDVVAGNLEDLAKGLKDIQKRTPKSIKIIDESIARYAALNLK